MKMLFDLILNQSPVLLVLLVFSVICVAAILDRLLFWLWSAFRCSGIVSAFLQGNNVDQIELIRRLERRRRRHYCEELLLTGLTRPGSNGHLVQTATEQVGIMSARLGTLDLIAKVAPLVGILGTVVGMAASFGGIGSMMSSSPEAISKGISLALKTTACGLVISIAASLAAGGFRKCIDRASLKMGRLICELK